jgi:hypothetical protein
MARVVVVASAEVERSELRDAIDPGDELVVVAPAVEQSFLEWLANDEGDARAQARDVAEGVDDEAPTDAEQVQVKPDPPAQLVRDAIAEHNPDRIVVALRAGDDATWLEDGELDEIPREIEGVPVTQIRIG